MKELLKIRKNYLNKFCYMYKGALLLIVLLINQKIIFGQKNDQYDFRRRSLDSVIFNQISSIVNDRLPCEKIIYSIFNLDYQIVVTNNTDYYRLFFFKTKEKDSVPVLLYFKTELKDDINYSNLFNRAKYWKRKIFFDWDVNREPHFLDSNKSDFYFFDKDGTVIAEFHLPTFMDNHPLQINHDFFYNIRTELIKNYIMR